LIAVKDDIVLLVVRPPVYGEADAKFFIHNVGDEWHCDNQIGSGGEMHCVA
jgi:hypothetical protein